jgi:3-hydroxyisobutyrate dehydrogenase-like beta-hydroxyacid dehydrogenase
LDATISGSSEQLRRGEALAMVGGPIEAFKRCAAVWASWGGRTLHVGESGDGARLKLVTNLVLGLNRAALAEGLALAEAMGLDLASALDVLRCSAAYSRIMDSKGGKMIAGDFTPEARLSQHLKDVRLILQSAGENGITLPLSETHRQLLERAEAEGLGAVDNSAIIEVLRKSNP